MWDYDDKSAPQAVNDGCLNGAASVEVLTEHAGAAAIRALFADLFADGVGSGASQNFDAARTAPAAPYAPQTVDDAWLNQVEAFAGQDYGEKSMLQAAIIVARSLR